MTSKSIHFTSLTCTSYGVQSNFHLISSSTTMQNPCNCLLIRRNYNQLVEVRLKSDFDHLTYVVYFDANGDSLDKYCVDICDVFDSTPINFIHIESESFIPFIDWLQHQSTCNNVFIDESSNDRISIQYLLRFEKYRLRYKNRSILMGHHFRDELKYIIRNIPKLISEYRLNGIK